MDNNSIYNLPDEEFDDPANREDYPDTGLDRHNTAENLTSDDDRDIDIDVKHSEELPDGDDVDLNRAE